MSRMKLLLDVIEDMRSLADSLQAVANALGQSDPEEPLAPASATEAPPAPAPAAPPPKAITREEVRAVLAERSHDGYTDQVRGLLQKYGAEKLSGVDPKHYVALLKDAEVLGHAT
ncbi:rRNA biogenesis protein rrp5 [Acutalibacter caecimuris]|uniref:rRNA biogenesis protein rrp5 n=1 Tax=Acutalibacter caecimuris TaxID=3093657 RepID=UPI002AC8DDC6|nr:rRNA biogenesis protein rrp5 [Acutalibacter sp. M00118]